jgi:hypothetical protein
MELNHDIGLLLNVDMPLGIWGYETLCGGKIKFAVNL